MTIALPSLLYAALICCIFYVIRKELRVYLLSLASLGYVLYLDRYSCVVVFLAAGAAWILGKLIEILRRSAHIKTAITITGISVALSASLLSVLKFLPTVRHYFTAGSIMDRLIIPIGFSYYTFQIISYFIDIYKGTAAAESDPFRLFLYLAWFPKFISGPIERTGRFHEELERIKDVRLLDTDRWKRVISYLVTGIFMKIVIADRLCIYVDQIFEHYDGFSTIWLTLGSLFYTIQIYADFAGYSLTAIGISLAFGIKLSDNFLMPYLSQNITEFWRRWHISLSNWLRDYLYIPLGGNRKGDVRKIVNTIIVFVVCGLWHGAGISFLIWGLLHGIYSAIDSFFRSKGYERIRSGFIGRTLTFLAVSFAWIFFRAESLEHARAYLYALFTTGMRWHSYYAEKEVLELSPQNTWIIILSLLFLLGMDIISYRKKQPFPELMGQAGQVPRWALITLMVFVILVFGAYGPELNTAMIYMQF